jgi:hypothetical protein
VILWIIQASIVGGAPWVSRISVCCFRCMVLVIFSVIQSLPLGKGADGRQWPALW